MVLRRPEKPRPRTRIPHYMEAMGHRPEIPLSLLGLMIAEEEELVMPAIAPKVHKMAENGLDEHFVQGASIVTEVDSINRGLESCAHPSKAARDPQVIVEIMEGFLQRFLCALPLATHVTRFISNQGRLVPA